MTSWSHYLRVTFVGAVVLWFLGPAEEAKASDTPVVQPSVLCVRTFPEGATVRSGIGPGCGGTPCAVVGGSQDTLIIKKDGYEPVRVDVEPETTGVYALLKKSGEASATDATDHRNGNNKAVGAMKARILVADEEIEEKARECR